MRDSITEIFDVRLVVKTDRAILVDYDGVEEWLPLSQVEIIEADTIDGGQIAIEIPFWLAKKKGWSED